MYGNLSASFFGGFELRRDGELLAGFAYDKVKALFAYLAIEPAVPVERSLLAGLLWPEQPEEKARHSLRQALSQLRAAIGEDSFQTPVFLAHRTSLQRNRQAGLETDVEKFEGNLNRPFADEREEVACLQAAVELYQGELLAGLSLSQTASFEEWLASRREHYHRRAVAALEKIVTFYEGQMAYARARTFAERWVDLEPWREAAHRKLMLILARMGRRSLALKQYERCRRVLSEEFGLEPDAQTELLFQRIRSMGNDKSDLPHSETPFIGRQEELSLVSRYLVDPDVRLITILGPGGIGKSRLAIQAGRLVAGEGGRLFLNGAVFVPLDSVSEQERLVAAIAQALSYIFEPGEEPASQLLRYLKDKELLLILDNFEQLVGETSRGFLVSLVKETGDLKLLVTSREKLNLRSEFLLQLQGLQIPDLNASSAGISLRDARAHSAVEFLMSVLKQVKPNIILTAEDIPVLVRICRLVEGMPLALELAASWSDTFPLEEIARQVERDMHFLKADWGDVPARHRSIRAVIDVSWRLLAERERAVFRRLSVFQGGFTLQAAQAVTGASTGTLSRLVSKSFLQYDSKADRYRIHELLRQFAAEELERAGEVAAARERHLAYFLQLAEQAGPQLWRDQEIAWLDRLESEYDNLRTALDWSLSSQSKLGIQGGMSLVLSLEQFLLRRGHYNDAASWLAGLLAHPHAAGKLEAFADGLRMVAALNSRVFGKYEEAQRQFERSLAIAEKQGDSLILAHVLRDFGSFYTYEVDLNHARVHLERALVLYQQLGYQPGIATVLRRLGHVASGRFGHVDMPRSPRSYYRESIQIWKTLGNSSGTALTLYWSGHYIGLRGEFAEARPFLEESLAIYRQLSTNFVEPTVLFGLGYLEFAAGDTAAAIAYFEEMLALVRDAGTKGRLSGTLHALGEIYRYEEDYVKAISYYNEALALAREIGDRQLQIWALTSQGFTFFRQGKVRRAWQHLEEALMVSCELRAAYESAVVLIGLAGVSAAAGGPQRAARILGGVEALLETTPVVIRVNPADDADHQYIKTLVQEQLDEGTFDPLIAEGRAMAAEGLERVAQYALEENL